jgi:hypothetical protein
MWSKCRRRLWLCVDGFVEVWLARLVVVLSCANVRSAFRELIEEIAVGDFARQPLPAIAIAR